MERTVRESEAGAFRTTATRQLRVRPTFRLDRDELRWIEPPDFNEFASVQDELMKSEFQGRRSRRKRMRFLIGYYFDVVLQSVRFWFESPTRTSELKPAPLDENVLRLNLKIIEKFALDVARYKSELIILYAAAYFGDEPLATQLMEFCRKSGIGYVDLSDHLVASEKAGNRITWEYDGHFNEHGNSLLASAAYNWILSRPSQ
jgi:hypothetical protein